MKRIYVLLSVVVAANAWRLSDLARDEWNTFKLEHKKHYENAAEEAHRMKIYLSKRYMIAKHNRRFHRGLETFTLKTNQFSDMTHQEYLKITKGLKFKSRFTTAMPNKGTQSHESDSSRNNSQERRSRRRKDCNHQSRRHSRSRSTHSKNHAIRQRRSPKSRPDTPAPFFDSTKLDGGISHGTPMIPPAGVERIAATPNAVPVARNFSKESRRTNKNPVTMFLSPANVVLNESVDWRQVGAVSRVQNQLECNSCWAFSATGALEGQLFRKNKTLVPLSVQNLIDCSKDNLGCEGGNMDDAFEYINYNKGIDIEKYYPYEAKNYTCRYNPLYSGGYDVGFQDIPEGDEEKLKEAVATIGPVSAAIDSTLKSFATYSHGVYYDENCSNNLVHAVLVVGYGTDKLGGDYWLLKNSYGTTWGEDGYMRLARNRQNHCGIASYTSYPLIPK